VEAHLNPTSGIDKSWSRNASLAQVKLFFDSSTAFSSSQQGKVAAIVNYLQRYGKASTAYNDLRPFVECLDSEERKQLLEILKSNTVFSDSKEIGDGQYPTKEDVNPLFTI
jgi:N-terminal acetyltransferase B complex non-catalytic subunit